MSDSTPGTYEAIMEALLALLRANGGTTFAYYSRRFLTWEEMVQKIKDGAILCPALFLYDGVGMGGGIIKFDPRGRGTPGVRTMQRTIVVYSALPGGFTPAGPDGETPGGSVMAPLLEAIEDAFDPDQEGTLTLGGLVSHCWIEGDVMWATGDIDPNGLGMMAIPVRIMIP